MMPRRPFDILLRVALAIACTVIAPAAPIVHAADDLAPQHVADNARCPVCGMYPARYPKWMAQIVFKDSSAASFDSPFELFRFLNAMAKYDKKHRADDVGAIYVTNYGGKGWLDARKAYFVIGSKALGPMNDPNAPAFATAAAAAAFAREQGGKVLAFDDVTPELIDAPADAPHDHGTHHHHH